MVGLNLKNQLQLLCFIPMITLFVTNGILIFLFGTPIMMVINFLIFTVVLKVASTYLESLAHKILQHQKHLSVDIEIVNFSTKLLIQELNHAKREARDLENWKKEIGEVRDSLHVLQGKLGSFDVVYSDLKELLIVSMRAAEQLGPANGKSHITIAKELGRICADAKVRTLSAQDQSAASLSSFRPILKNLEESQEHLQLSEKTLLIAENIMHKTQRLGAQLSQLPEIKELDAAFEEHPFKMGVLRKAFRLAEKKVA